MSVPNIKFNVQDQPEFYNELRKRVNFYFTDNKISKYANNSMRVKTAFMLILYFVPLILMLTGILTGLWPIIGLWAIMGFGIKTFFDGASCGFGFATGSGDS